MTTDSEPEKEGLREFVDKAIREKGVPGAAVGVLHKGETVTVGSGVTSVENPLPVTDETLFQIGSNTKTFTGTIIMRLVEMGKLDLEATVRTYVPDFRVQDETAASQATIRHLLTHTGGWEGDVFRDTGAGDDALDRYVATMAELEQLAPIGKVYSYCSSGFCLAGLIIEKVTGKSYQAVLKELVLEPLGMESSYLEPGDVMTHRFAVGHHVAEGGAKVARPWPLPRSLWPAGGLICNVKDLLSYARFHVGDGSVNDATRLLSAESMAQMRSPQVAIWGDGAVGLSWHTGKLGRAHFIVHLGGTIGQNSSLELIPEHGFAVIVLTNADQGNSVTTEASRWALKEYLGLEAPEPKPIESTEEELAQYVGRYVRPSVEIELGMLGGRLIGQMTFKKGGFPTKDVPPPPTPPPIVVGRCEKDRLIALDSVVGDAMVDIVRKPDGSIGWLRFAGRIHARVA